MYELIPESCQLILATHSIGIMRRALEIETDNPGSVVFLDFGNLDFDQPQIIEPVKPDRRFWQKAHKVALDDLASLLAPKQVVICEGHPETERSVNNHSIDASCYENIFNEEFPDTRFISMGNDREVSNDRGGLAKALISLFDGVKIVKLIDRDNRSDQEIDDELKRGVRVLSRKNLETYLFDFEVLEALAKSVGKESECDFLLERYREVLSIDDLPLDLKRASGQIYNECKNILKLYQHGNNSVSFMRDTLAPIVKPGMQVYEELRRDIFGSV